jgi:hypothetical protein
MKVVLLALAPVLLLGVKASAQPNSCKTFITTAEHDRGASTIITARNISGRPIVAYVVSDTPVIGSDTKSYSLHGVFTNGDSLHSRQAIQLGTIPRRQLNGLLRVDYVRLSDGTTCGALATQDARQVAARFQ